MALSIELFITCFHDFFITRTITYIFISVIYLSIFYEIGLLTHNVINYVLLLLQSVLIGNLLQGRQ